MGLTSSKEKKIRAIIELSVSSPKHLTESDVQEIMMNSQFNESELLKLYKKFQDLDDDSTGSLTNRQLLNLDEFKYNPFRTRLIYALQLKTDQQVQEIKDMKNQDVKLEDLGKILKNEEEPKKGTNETEESDDKEGSTEGEKPKKEKQAEEADDDAELEMNEDTPDFIESMGTTSYITFDEFAKIMSLFNPRTGIEEKIQCKFKILNLPQIVYFRIFDVNEDKKIDRDDLKKIMKMLFGSKISAEDMKTLGEKIF